MKFIILINVTMQKISLSDSFEAKKSSFFSTLVFMSSEIACSFEISMYTVFFNFGAQFKLYLS